MILTVSSFAGVQALVRSYRAVMIVLSRCEKE